MGRAWESCLDDWANAVRLASDRASTGCWRWPCPFSRSPDWCEPLQENKINNNNDDDVPCTWSAFNCPPRYTCPPTTASGLASPHQNVSWQNRKAAVCSRHLKVHLHTRPVPTKFCQPEATSARAEGVGFRHQGSACMWVVSFFLFFLPDTCYDKLHF